ncbi:MAG TPA: methyltransferase domain-containing protein [Candidatus Limnocylindria bacterium]|nr:methyltransferase domain-containing protein [Candidatus Limnocylindria bacterium]
MARLARAFPRTAVDAGTGDGRYPLHVARTRADTLAIGLDASADALAFAARRAMRERLPNLVLLREPAEGIPLESFADEVTIHFPWGSLLRGALAEDESVFAAICRLPRPGGRLTMLLSVTAREGREPLTDEDRARVARAYRSRGLTLTEHRAVVRADVDAARSSWGKRLDVGGTRPGELLRFVRGSAAARAPVPSLFDGR